MRQHWKLQSSTSIVDSPWLKFLRNAYELPTGRTIDDYFVIERSSFVLVVALSGHRIALVNQYRPATDDFYWGLPAGYINAGESPEVAALRELKEEVGVEGSQARCVGELHPLPGYIRSPAFVVLCRFDSPAAAPIDTEEIAQAAFIPVDEAQRMIRTGAIREMQAVAAILLVLDMIRAESGAT